MSSGRYRYVEVEVSLGDFDDEELLEELKERGVSSCRGDVSLMSLFDAMNAGNKERALELLRVYLMDQTGRLLP